MPAKSQAQFRAMQAAAHGHSTLGIPQKVGKEFAAAVAVEGEAHLLDIRSRNVMELATGREQ